MVVFNISTWTVLRSADGEGILNLRLFLLLLHGLQLIILLLVLKNLSFRSGFRSNIRSAGTGYFGRIRILHFHEARIRVGISKIRIWIQFFSRVGSGQPGFETLYKNLRAKKIRKISCH